MIIKNLKLYQLKKSRIDKMLKLDIILPHNDVMAISEGLRKIGVGGLTVSKKRGRGKNPGPEIHASKGSEIFVPQFSDKYVLELIIPEEKEEEAIQIIQKNARDGKIFVSQVLRAIDIESGSEGIQVI